MLLVHVAAFILSLISLATAFAPQTSSLLRSLHPIATRDLPIGTCNSDTPCVNGACCGTNGLCGYSPTECGSGNCTSNCDAKAQCGQYGAPGSQNCPLNVCCSQFGFCGETSDFCGTGCQAGYGDCGPVNAPSCSGGSSVNARTIGYYESWANTRSCESISPSQLNLNGFTHVNFGFGYFDPDTFQITPMDENAASLYSEFTNLKSSYEGLETWISIGGWSFGDPGPTQQAFSRMSSTAANRAAFINGAIKFMDTYGFDGVDLDWEYPAAEDRGGLAADFENYVTLLQEMRSSFGSKYGLTITIPTSYWYLQHFDVANLQDSVDWFNFMSYDLHGTWDAQSIYTGPYIMPHTNITEIDEGLDLLWRAGVSPGKVTMGLAYYGRSFTLEDPSCNTPNGVCKFTGGGNAGQCSDASGILDDEEIANIIAENNLTPVHDTTAAVKWITWDSNQWVSYDDADTFTEKRAFANGRCLGGLMVWALDQMSQSGLDGIPGITSSSTSSAQAAQQSVASQGSQDQLASTVCYTSDCGAGCKAGTTEVSMMNGQPGQVSTKERCTNGQSESLCCANGGTMGTCQWRGYRGAGLSCLGTCADGETEVARNTNYLDSKGSYTCNGGQLSYCCAGFKAPSQKSVIASSVETAAESAAEAAAEQAAFDLAAKAFCRIAVPALLAPLELLEDLIPIIGEIADAIELAATPGLIDLCTKDIEKEGSAEFKVFGKKKTLSFDEPTATAEDRPPESSHESAKTKSSSSCQAEEKRAGVRGAATTTTYSSSTTSEVYKTCDFGLYPQPCAHYSSVVRENPALSTVPCIIKEGSDPGRPEVDDWYGQHNNGWINGWMQEKDVDCEADEWPPKAIWYSRDKYDGADPDLHPWIRYLPGSQNSGTSNFARGVCPNDKSGFKSNSVNLRSVSEVTIGCRTTTHYTVTETITYPALVLRFKGSPGFAADDPDGLTANPCWPSTLINDPGFALLTNDNYYDGAPIATVLAIQRGLYQQAPGPQYVNGKVNRPGYERRSVFDRDDFDPEDLIYVDANITRKLTETELFEEFGFRRCADAECSAEKKELGIESAVVRGVPRTMPAMNPALATTTSVTDAFAAPTATVHSKIHLTSAVFPQKTVSLEVGGPVTVKSKHQIEIELRGLLDKAAASAAATAR